MSYRNRYNTTIDDYHHLLGRYQSDIASISGLSKFYVTRADSFFAGRYWSQMARP